MEMTNITHILPHFKVEGAGSIRVFYVCKAQIGRYPIFSVEICFAKLYFSLLPLELTTTPLDILDFFD